MQKAQKSRQKRKKRQNRGLDDQPGPYNYVPAEGASVNVVSRRPADTADDAASGPKPAASAAPLAATAQPSAGAAPAMAPASSVTLPNELTAKSKEAGDPEAAAPSAYPACILPPPFPLSSAAVLPPNLQLEPAGISPYPACVLPPPYPVSSGGDLPPNLQLEPHTAHGLPDSGMPAATAVINAPHLTSLAVAPADTLSSPRQGTGLARTAPADSTGKGASSPHAACQHASGSAEAQVQPCLPVCLLCLAVNCLLNCAIALVLEHSASS